jgi:putative exporter of polyketide antibiotics
LKTIEAGTQKDSCFCGCGVADLALLIATIGAALALLSGHARWIELAWLSIANSLFVLVLGKLWPIETDEARSD